MRPAAALLAAAAGRCSSQRSLHADAPPNATLYQTHPSSVLLLKWRRADCGAVPTSWTASAQCFFHYPIHSFPPAFLPIARLVAPHQSNSLCSSSRSSSCAAKPRTPSSSRSMSRTTAAPPPPFMTRISPHSARPVHTAAAGAGWATGARVSQAHKEEGTRHCPRRGAARQ